MTTCYQLGAPCWHPGFFCCYQVVVGFLNYCEVNAIHNFHVIFERGLYFDLAVGDNWWEYYFEPIEQGTTVDSIIHTSDMQKSAWATDAISSLSRVQAGKLIGKYIHLKPPILQIINDVVTEHNFAHFTMIGVHYRGTDKSSEAPRVEYSVVKHAVDIERLQYPNNKIFVATDEQEFIEYMQLHFKEDMVCRSVRRSPNNGTPLHHNDGAPQQHDRYILGEDAVIDCYLLARCQVLVRTQSNLSSSAANINPSLKVVDLNHNRFGWR